MGDGATKRNRPVAALAAVAIVGIIESVDEPTASMKASAPRITACIIARDEAEHLGACLESVAFCDEIVLVDSGSTDGTPELALAAGARVVRQDWLGYAAQRNVALEHAAGEWVLEIDADERVSPALRAEIEAFIAAPPARVTLAGLPLREVFLGRPLGRSAKYPKYRHRLLRRGAHRHDERRTVHEGFVPDGPVHPFGGDLVHLLASGWREAVADAWRYARLEAGQMSATPTPVAVITGAVLRPAGKLAYRLAVDGGWRDGWRGAARIALDCATDSVVWLRCALGRRGADLGASGVGEGDHYGAWKTRRGCQRVVGVAGGEQATAEARRWLARAAAAGADAALICDADGAESEVRVRRLARLGPFGLVRALDAEEQLRPLDAVVGFGWRTRLLLRAVPSGLRGARRDVLAAIDPRTVGWDAGSREEPAGT
jgi:hypothetical protein